MLTRCLNDLVKFLGLVTLLGMGAFGFYTAIVAYQLCQVDTNCPSWIRTQPTPQTKP